MLGAQAYNLGTGQGLSVLQMVEAFERISERPIPYQFAHAGRVTWQPFGRTQARLKRVGMEG
ncbi:hypothetical protein HSBAA_63650 [Vreelandella sulfidaeris]|uniref:Uncharacterized protein n=1 Tax=Vreelandella sulfidaeris TaxID=115553 RepID=A0A455ULC5_9GAMM|nr:hypothetical protein HSBAA_63650 [Halomonas sulfidaeris]